MSKKLKVTDEDYAINGFAGTIRTEFHKYTTGEVCSWEEGHVLTEDGIVNVFSSDTGTALTFAFQGRVFCRRINRRYSKRYLVTLAKRFAVQVVWDKR